VTIENLGSRIGEIDLYQNEWPWRLFRGRLRSCQPLRHIHHWISQKLLEIEVWFQRASSRKWPMGNRKVTAFTSHNPERSSRDPNTLRAKYLETTGGAI